jgi:excisionase family DNA binding protein
MPARLLTTRDLQELMNVDKSTIYRMAEDGRLPAMKVGRQWRFREDLVLEWLSSRSTKGAQVAVAGGPAGDLLALLPPASVQAAADLVADSLGTMVILADMAGKAITEVSNACGLYAAVDHLPGVMERCTDGWKALASQLELEPRWQPTHLGFLCARSLIRVGDQLKGLVIAAGVAPDQWPPDADGIAAIAAEVGAPVDTVAAHIEEVHRLSAPERTRVLQMLPRIGMLISHMASERGVLMSRLQAIALLAGEKGSEA